MQYMPYSFRFVGWQKLGLLLPMLFLVMRGTSQISEYIHVDQFGYWPNAEKVAVLSNPMVGYNSGLSYTPASTLEVRDATTQQVVWSGSPTSWHNGNTHDASGDQGWWLDFSGLTQAGQYYIYDPSTQEQSATFDIVDNPYLSVLQDAGRAFYYNRCNAEKASPFAEASWTDGMNFLNPLQDANCRYYLDPQNASLERDLSGGWFDAGDYNKYTTFAETPIHDLLWAYQQSPTAFTADWNIPESGNGLPDILDEVKWELDWLLKMINSDGSVIIKMGSIDYGENALAPPSANKDPRYYGKTCTSASIAMAGMLAHAAEVYQSFPSMTTFAQRLEDQAILTFGYWETQLAANNIEEDCDDGTIKAGDADRDEAAQKQTAVMAAAHLFALTGDPKYDSYFQDHLNDAIPIRDSYWEQRLNINDALLHYTTLPNADANTRTSILNSASTSADNNWNGFFKWNERDLYRAFCPDWTFYWGSNQSVAAFGVLNHQYYAYLLNPADSASFRRKFTEQLHYFHGVNPLGIVYLSNMNGRGAERSANQIYHTWFADGTDWDDAQTSRFGPAPGYVPGGPNQSPTDTQSPPANQPLMKSYLDYNNSWPLASWEITEPAIYYQAKYIRLLATQVTSPKTTTSIQQVSEPAIQLFPNPTTTGRMTLRSLPTQTTLFLYNTQGQVVMKQAVTQPTLQIDLGRYAPGLYQLRLARPDGVTLWQAKAIYRH